MRRCPTTTRSWSNWRCSLALHRRAVVPFTVRPGTVSTVLAGVSGRGLGRLGSARACIKRTVGATAAHVGPVGALLGLLCAHHRVRLGPTFTRARGELARRSGPAHGAAVVADLSFLGTGGRLGRGVLFSCARGENASEDEQGHQALHACRNVRRHRRLTVAIPRKEKARRGGNRAGFKRDVSL